MTEKLTIRKIYGVENYKLQSSSVYYTRRYPKNNDREYHPSCYLCAYYMECPYTTAWLDDNCDSDTLCMKYVYYLRYTHDLMYLKYDDETSRRRYVLMLSGIPYKYDQQFDFI